MGVPDVAIFITDGYPTMKVENTLTEAENAKKQQIYIIAVSNHQPCHCIYWALVYCSMKCCSFTKYKKTGGGNLNILNIPILPIGIFILASKIGQPLP